MFKGYAAPETKAAVERARLLIDQAEARGEPPEDPLLLFSVLYLEPTAFWMILAARLSVVGADCLFEKVGHACTPRR